MLGKTHALGGLVAWQAASLLVPGPLWIEASAVPFAIWGAYGPDMDHAKATWARSFWGGPTLARWTARAVGGHRMGTHSFASVIFSGLALWCLLALADLASPLSAEWRAIWVLAWMSGWASHLALDGLTVMGIGALYPFSRRRWAWGALRTSKSRTALNPGERTVVSILYLTGIVLFIYLIIGVLIEQA